MEAKYTNPFFLPEPPAGGSHPRGTVRICGCPRTPRPNTQILFSPRASGRRVTPPWHCTYLWRSVDPPAKYINPFSSRPRAPAKYINMGGGHPPAGGRRKLQIARAKRAEIARGTHRCPRQIAKEKHDIFIIVRRTFRRQTNVHIALGAPRILCFSRKKRKETILRPLHPNNPKMLRYQKQVKSNIHHCLRAKRAEKLLSRAKRASVAISSAREARGKNCFRARSARKSPFCT